MEIIERNFARLKHANPAQRQAAGSWLGEAANEAIVARLVGLLGEQDVQYRRAAVQALGMCGEGGDAIIAVTRELLKTQDAVTRASCAKALAAAALHHPQLRASFDRKAVDALADVAINGDPVARIAAVGALATMGSDAESLGGCDEAYHALVRILGRADAACGAVAVGAVAQIAQNARTERKAGALETLRGLATGTAADDEATGLGYVREMARSHVEQLESGGSVRAAATA